MFMHKDLQKKVGFNSINDLPPNIQTEVNIKAGKLALQKREAALKLGIDFGIETTASSMATLRLVEKAHKLNYEVNLLYVMLPSHNLHIQRVSQRVRKGGHNISSEDIKRRFERARMIFPELLKKVDSCTVYDNTLDYQIALTKENGGYKFFQCQPTIKRFLEKTVKELEDEKSVNTKKDLTQ